MSQKNISGKKIEGTITSDDLLGKEVIDLDGKIIGISEKVLIDPENLDFVGIEIDKGFLKKGLSIGKNYIKKIGRYAIFLNIKVAYEIKGMEVFGKDGGRVGKVKMVELSGEKNRIKNLHVNKGMMKKEFIVPASHIETIGENVILKVDKLWIKENLGFEKDNN